MADKNDTTMMIPFCVSESIADRQNAIIKKLWIMCILLIALLVCSNGAWLWYESQFETVSTTQEVEQSIDGSGSEIRMIGIGDVNGESEADR